MSPSPPNSHAISTVCIYGHNPLSTTILQSLSKTAQHIHLLHSSPHSLDLPFIPDPSQITFHHHPTSTFTDQSLMTNTLSSLFPAPDILISTTHGGDSTLQTNLISACIDAKISRFIPAEFGHDSLNPTVKALLPPNAERAKVIAFLQQREESIEWVGIATGLDISRRLVDGNMGVDLAWQSASIYGNGEERFYVSTPQFVGGVVKKVVERWEGVKNRYLCVGECRTSYRGILGELEGQINCLFEVGRLEREEGLAEAKRRIEGGWPDAGMFLLERSVLEDESCFGGFEKDDDFQVEFGLESESLGGIVKGAVHEFKHHGKGGCGCG